MTKLKFCSKCGQEKPVSEFYKDKSAKDGLGYYCKICSRVCQAKSSYRTKKERGLSVRTVTSLGYQKKGQHENYIVESIDSIMNRIFENENANSLLAKNRVLLESRIEGIIKEHGIKNVALNFETGSVNVKEGVVSIVLNKDHESYDNEL